MKSNSNSWLAASSAIMAIALATPALAQSASTDNGDTAAKTKGDTQSASQQGDDNPTEMPPSPQSSEPQSGTIRDIVVTAQKRSENVQDVPVAVTALDQKALSKATVNTVEDISGQVPSLVIDDVTAGPSAAAIAIRGISFEDIEKSFDPAVGVSVDGVFIGTNTGQLLDNFDLKSIQVLRGPQGTLFGRNTIGGVIQIERTDPTDEPGVRGRFSYAKYNTKSARLLINSGKIGDFIALKAFGYYDKTDGFYNNVIQNRDDGKYETLTGGITVLIEPSSAFSAELTYEHKRERGETVSAAISNSGDVICAAPGAPGFSPPNECNRFPRFDDHGVYTTFETAPRDVRNDTDSLTGNVRWDLTPGLTLHSVTGYSENDEDVQQDFDGSSADFFATDRQQKYHQFSQELRLNADVTDWANLVLGAYYFDSNYTLDQFTAFGPVLGDATLEQYVDHTARSYAGFADAQFDLTDSLKMALGIRYSEDKKEIFNNFGQVAALVRASLPDYDGKSCVAATGVIPGTMLPSYSPADNCSGSVSFGKFTYRANAQYRIDPSRMVYVSYSRGYRSGGFNGRAGSPTSLGPYEPETVDAYEVGLKAEWLDRTLRTNLAAYYTSYNNKQEEVVQPTPPGAASPQETVVKNAASATIKGLEIETTAQLSSALQFNATFSYTDAEYDNFFNDVVGPTAGSPPDLIPDDVSTLTLRRAPEFQWSTGLNYSHNVGSSGRVDASTLLRFQSSYATCIIPDFPITLGAVTNDNRCFTKDNARLSAQIGYTFLLGNGREISLSVFGKNLTDTRDIQATLPVGGLFAFSSAIEPRTYGVQLGFEF